MTYKLKHLIEDLEKQDQDKPVKIGSKDHPQGFETLSQKGFPQYFETLYIDQTHIILNEHNAQSVKGLLELAKMFPKKGKNVFIRKIMDSILRTYSVIGLEEHHGSVYLMVNEELDD